MRDNKDREPARKASGAQGCRISLRQPWDSRPGTPLLGTVWPKGHGAVLFHPPPGTVKSFEAVTNKGPGCKTGLWTPQRKALPREASQRSTFPSVSAQDCVTDSKKMKLPTKQKSSIQRHDLNAVLVLLLHFIGHQLPAFC